LNTESEHCLALWMNDGFVRIPASAMRRGASILLEKKQSIGEEGVEEVGGGKGYLISFFFLLLLHVTSHLTTETLIGV